MKHSMYMDWLKNEGAITYEDNVIHAERAFLANSILKWCTERAKRENFSKAQAYEYLRILRFYVKKKIDLCWQDGIITVSADEESAPTTGGGPDNACSGMETSNGE